MKKPAPAARWRITLSVLCAAAAALLSSIGPGDAQGSKILKFSVTVPEDHPAGFALTRFAQIVNDKAKGALTVQLFFNNQLGGELEVAQNIRLGAIEGALLSNAVLSRWVPEGDVFELPFLFRDNDQWRAVLMGDFGRKFGERYEPQGFKVLAFATFGARQIMSSFPIVKPEDVKGKKMRVLQNPLHIQVWKALGANPTPIPAPEIYSSMQTKVVDYFDNNGIAWFASKFYEVGPHFTNLRHIHAPGTYLMSANVFKALTPEQQATILGAAEEASIFQFNLVALHEGIAINKAKAAGGTVHEVPDRDAWRKATAPVWDEWAAKQKGGRELIDQITSTK